MKYTLIFIAGIDSSYELFNQSTAPGTMFQVSEFDTIEAANDYLKKLGHGQTGKFIIMPYYEVEK